MYIFFLFFFYSPIISLISNTLDVDITRAIINSIYIPRFLRVHSPDYYSSAPFKYEFFLYESFSSMLDSDIENLTQFIRRKISRYNLLEDERYIHIISSDIAAV